MYLQYESLTVEASGYPRLDVGPGTHILVFLLRPHQLSIRVLVTFLFDEVIRERCNLQEKGVMKSHCK